MILLTNQSNVEPFLYFRSQLNVFTAVGPVTLKEVGLSQIQQFGGDLIQGRSVVFQEDADTEMNKTSDCRFAVEVLTRQARKGK